MNNTAATVADLIDAAERRRKNGAWTPASGGTEVPFTARNGRRLLYVYQATTGDHAYLDVDTDLILSDEVAFAWLGL